MTTGRFVLVCVNVSTTVTNRLLTEFQAVLGISGASVVMRTHVPSPLAGGPEQPVLVVNVAATGLSPAEMRIATALHRDLPAKDPGVALWPGVKKSGRVVRALESARRRACGDARVEWQLRWSIRPVSNVLVHAKSAEHVELAVALCDGLGAQSSVVAGGALGDPRILLAISEAAGHTPDLLATACRVLHENKGLCEAQPQPEVLVSVLSETAFQAISASFPYDEGVIDATYDSATRLICPPRS